MSALRSFGKWVWGALTAPTDLFALQPGPASYQAQLWQQQFEAARQAERLDREASAAEARASAERLAAAAMPKRDFRKTDTAPAQGWPDNAAESFGGEGYVETISSDLNSEKTTETHTLFAMSDGIYKVVDNRTRIVKFSSPSYKAAVTFLHAHSRLPPPDTPKTQVTDRPGWRPGEGRKDDDKKARLDLIPPEVIMALGETLTFGAKKYSDRNWEKGMRWGRCYAAALRHMVYWWAGKGPTTQSFLFGSLDDETGKSHLWHALCCIAFLVAYEERGVGEDDRFTGSASTAGEARR